MIRRLLSFPLAAVVCLFFATASHAQTTYTWNGTAGPLWSSIGNWTSSPSTGTAPTTDTTNTLLVLAGTTQLTNTLDYNLGANSLSFAAGAGAFVVGNSNSSSLTLGSGGILVSNNSQQAINAPVILAANQTWTNSGNNLTTLQLGGAITTGGSNLSLAGTGNFNVLQAITGGGTLTKSGTGQLSLYQNNANAALTINAGIVTVTPIGAGPNPNPLGTGLVTLGGGTLSFRASLVMTPVALTAASFQSRRNCCPSLNNHWLLLRRVLRDLTTTTFGRRSQFRFVRAWPHPGRQPNPLRPMACPLAVF